MLSCLSMHWVLEECGFVTQSHAHAPYKFDGTDSLGNVPAMKNGAIGCAVLGISILCSISPVAIAYRVTVYLPTGAANFFGRRDIVQYQGGGRWMYNS